MNLKGPSPLKYNGKNILAIDYGSKVTGLALFTPGRDPFPMPYGRLVSKEDDDLLIDEIIRIIEEELIDLLVLGLPFLTDGSATTQTELVRKFAKHLEEKSSLPLYFQDETLSTFEAEERMKSDPRYNFKVNPKKIDALAASIILEDFINK